MKKGDQAEPSPHPSPYEVEGEGVLRANVPVEEVELFTLGRWGEFQQWKCTKCPWDTLEGEEVFMEHWRATHAPAPEPPKASMIARADRFGNEVK